MKKKKEVFGFRKSKIAKTLCGAVLSAAFLAVVDQQVLAAEVKETNSEAKVEVTTTGNPATNLPEAQGPASAVSEQSQTKAGEKDGGLAVEVSANELNQAVADAQAVGVKVIQDDTVDKGTTTTVAESAQKQAEIKDDYTKQADAIKTRTDLYKKDVAAYQTESEKVTAENQAADEKYKQDLLSHQKEVDKINAANTALKNEYEAKLAQYQKDLATVQEANAANELAYQNKLTAYQTELARVQKANAEAKAAYEKAVEENNANNVVIKAENAAISQRNATAKAEYETKLAQYQADLAQYQTELADYNKKLQAYNEEQEKIKKALVELEKDKDKDGHLKEPSAQSLVYDLEPNAQLTIETEGKLMTASAVDEAFKKDATQYGKKNLQLDNLNVKDLEAGATTSSVELYGNIGDKSDWTTNVGNKTEVKWGSVLLERGQSVTATYTNLQHSYYNGKKIAKIVYKYTVDPSSQFQNPSGKVWLGIFTDPTLGVFASAYTGQMEKNTSIFIKNEFTFYDEKDRPINFDNALLSVASLNREHNSIEMAKDYSGKFIKISGSSIDEKNGMIYATETLNFRQGQGGARWTMYQRGSEPGSGWDTSDAPNSWYGAGAIKISGSSNHVTVGATSATNVMPVAEMPQVAGKDNTEGKKPNIWYSLNGKIRAVNVPKVTKEKPTLPEEPTAPSRPAYEVEKALEPAPIPPVYENEPTPPVKTPDQPEPAKPQEPNYDPLPTPPVAPTPKQLPTPPAVPTVHFHYNQLVNQPQIEKKIKNEDGLEIDRTLVAKQSVVKFELKTEALTAGRPETTSFVLVDPLPSGYQFDLEATKSASADFETSYDAENHTVTFKATSATLAKYNADLTKSVATLYPTVVGRVLNDGATYTNNFTLTVNEAYAVKSNIVRVTTPGKPNDPDNPNNNYIKPLKVNKNKQGLTIDGKEVLAGSTNYYELTWDLDQYKGDKSSREAIQNGFYYVDDYPEEALDLHSELVKIMDVQGNPATGISVQQYDSLEAAPEKVQELLKKANITVKGAFQLFSADNPTEFYNKYVATGTSLVITDPMTVKSEFGKTGGKYENKAYQIDFGNGYATEAVVNNVPKLTLKKDVVVSLDPTGQNLDGQTIQLNQTFHYRLTGGLIPQNHSEDLEEYSFTDDYDQTGDQYTGTYKTFSSLDLQLKDGSIIQAGTDLTDQTISEIDTVNGLIRVRFKEEFLQKISLESPFQAETYLQMKRISVGTFANTYVSVVNSATYSSNTVGTLTPVPQTPESPRPFQKPKGEDPTSPSSLSIGKKLTSLPKTGTKDTTYMPYLGLAALVGVLGFGMAKRRED